MQFPITRNDMIDLTYQLPTADATLRGNTITALVTAALANQYNNTKTTITTAAITKGADANVEELFLELGQQGFVVNNGSTTFTVSF